MAGRLQEIFENAIDLAGAEREAYLRGACGADVALRADVDGLLRAHEQVTSFMASPTREHHSHSDAPTIGAPPSSADTLREGPGSRIGPYKLLQLIGEGGFGSVFMAEQEQPVRRKTALKIIKLGMDTRQVVARFEQERQALAILDHPNIAKVFDAGATETGRPYFVMELVKGEPIAAYCDRNSLSIGERLDLFAQVCSAVQHAHTKGIIHRDIKPSNILVSTQDGPPHIKVIDFGIAKATASKLTEKTLFTEHRQLIGTPEYMSPEQAEGSLDIDTRTDVYSLGVVLYELLTGTTPFASHELRSAAYAEIQRIIRESEPPKPSTRLSENSDSIATIAVQRRSEPRKLGLLVRGELDWIVMKALEKDRQRRYESASSLGSDIQRYLNREPVSAGPPSATYKFRKFVQRNRGKVFAAGLLAAVLVLGAFGTSAGMVWALRERARADKEAKQAVLAATAETKAKEEAQRRLTQVEKASDILSSIFQSIDPREIARSGRPLQAALVENLDKAVSELEGESIGDSRAVLNIQMRLGLSLLSLGESSRAIVVLEKASKTSADTLGPDDSFTLGCTTSLAMAYAGAGKFDLAIPMLEQLLAKRASQAQPDREALALTKHNLGLQYRQTGRAAEALPLFEQAASERKALLGPEHPYTLSTLNALATTYDELGKPELAIPLFKETVAAYQKKLGPEHPSTLAAMNNLGNAYRNVGDTAQAIPLLEEVVRISKLKLGSNHPDTMAMMNSLGFAYKGAGMNEKAVAILEEALLLMRTHLGNDHPNTMATMTNLAGTYWSLRQLDKSIPLFEEALTLQDRIYGRSRKDTRMTLANLGINYRDAGRLDDALPLLKEAYEASANDPRLAFVTPALADVYARLGMRDQAASTVQAGVARTRKSQTEGSPALAADLAKYGMTLLAAGDGAGAEPLLREALAIREKSRPDDWATFNTRSMLGEALASQSKFADAEPLLLAGYDGLKKREASIPPQAAARIPEAIERLVRLYEAMGDQAKAAEWTPKLESVKRPPPPKPKDK